MPTLVVLVWLRVGRAIVCHREWTFTACGGSVVVWSRGTQVCGFVAHATSIRRMLILGNVLITASERELKTWSVEGVCDGEAGAEMACVALPPGFTLTTLIHPPTYINKVVAGSEEGALTVFNISSCKAKFTSAVCGGVSVTALEPSPAVDVIAVGLADGRVLLHNIKLDKVRVCAVVESPSMRADTHAPCPRVCPCVRARHAVGVSVCARCRGRVQRRARHLPVLLHRPTVGPVPPLRILTRRHRCVEPQHKVTSNTSGVRTRWAHCG